MFHKTLEMNKIFLIVQREYLSRVRKKSFLVMTLLGPVLMALIMIVPLGLTMISHEKKSFLVCDENGTLGRNLKNSENITFTYLPGDCKTAKVLLEKSDFGGLIAIPAIEQDSKPIVQIISKENITIETQIFIESEIEKVLQLQGLEKLGISSEALESTAKDISVQVVRLQNGQEGEYHAAAAMTFGLFFSVLIYLFIFLYGVQVMRGVIEEKTSRIVEVIITSVRPFELMAGKIIGIALVGLTQFAIWIVLTAGISLYVSNRFQINRFDKLNLAKTLENTPDISQTMEMHQIVEALNSVPFVQIIFCFLFFFLGGYLLYGALFAAIGSAVDNETDTQQFMLPVTLPLVASFLAVQGIVQDPDGNLAFWMSIIPFTSPVAMMVRLPYGVPMGELMLSMVLLFIAFSGAIWLSGKIYRTGILMYGKKASYSEILKWLRQ